MEILVDYNNVQAADRRKGVMFVVDKIIHALGPLCIRETPRISIRLYDGWYEDRTLTQAAQRIAAEVLAKTPTTICLGAGPEQVKAVINVELAYSLKVAPAQHLWHTYRPRYYPGDVRFRDPRTNGCKDGNCPLIAAYRFFRTDDAPRAAVTLRPRPCYIEQNRS